MLERRGTSRDLIRPRAHDGRRQRSAGVRIPTITAESPSYTWTAADNKAQTVRRAFCEERFAHESLTRREQISLRLLERLLSPSWGKI